MNNHKTNKTFDKVDETADYKNGFTFDFKDNDYEISVRCSAKSGKEQVFVNGTLVAEKRSYRRKSIIQFTLGSHRYEVEFNVIDMFKGETHCTLVKDDTHIKTIKKALITKYQVKWGHIPFYFAFGALVGVIISMYLIDTIGG
jgi:hypothetical protein